MKVPCLIAAAVLLVGGCGQKGPLYFAPEEVEAPPPAATTPQQEQERKE